MIPRDFITEWRATAPWVEDFQVEQDLVISRALVDIFSHPLLQTELAFRGGTALYKLHLSATRYSEDIDLVQLNAGPAGPLLDALHDVLDPWLGEPRIKRAVGGVTIWMSSLEQSYARFINEGKDAISSICQRRSKIPPSILDALSKHSWNIWLGKDTA